MKLSNTKLIIFEGIPGSGKTTMAKRLYEYLGNQGIKSRLYNEGDSDHPVDLAWHAYLTRDEFTELITKYVEQADELCKHSIIEDDYAIVPYKRQGSSIYEDDLMNYLETREVCYCNIPTVPIEVFSRIFRKRWERFAQSSDLKDGITIFESALFQHQIHDLMRMYAPETPVIAEHLRALTNEVGDLKPIIFYITQSSVKETLERAWKQRTTPQYNPMASNIKFVENSQYGKKNKLTGVEGAIKFWEARKGIEFEVMNQLAVESFVIDNSDYNWDKVFDKVIGILGV